jgi:hypothetical protein
MDRPFDEDWMSEHEVDQLLVRPFGIVEAELGVRSSLLSQERPDRNSHGRDQRLEPLAARRVLQIFDDDRILATRADHRQQF